MDDEPVNEEFYRDAQKLILLKSDYDSILNYARSSTHFHEVVNSPEFWRDRVLSAIGYNLSKIPQMCAESILRDRPEYVEACLTLSGNKRTLKMGVAPFLMARMIQDCCLNGKMQMLGIRNINGQERVFVRGSKLGEIIFLFDREPTVNIYRYKILKKVLTIGKDPTSRQLLVIRNIADDYLINASVDCKIHSHRLAHMLDESGERFEEVISGVASDNLPGTKWTLKIKEYIEKGECISDEVIEYLRAESTRINITLRTGGVVVVYPHKRSFVFFGLSCNGGENRYVQDLSPMNISSVTFSKVLQPFFKRQ